MLDFRHRHRLPLQTKQICFEFLIKLQKGWWSECYSKLKNVISGKVETLKNQRKYKWMQSESHKNFTSIANQTQHG